jgi:hypothetical protein
MYKAFSKVISKIQTRIVLTILISSILLVLVVWNNNLSNEKAIEIKSEIPIEPEPKSKPEATHQSSCEPDPTLEPDLKTTPEPEPEPKSEPTPKTEPLAESEPEPESQPETKLVPDPPNTAPTQFQQATVRVGNDDFIFNPTKVETTRPDLFNQGYFSMFDVLVHLNKQDLINLEYHFDESLNAYLIDSINGEINWWYQTYYSGGWSERNVFRPDHYPWKEGTTLTFYKESSSRLESIYSIWYEEVERRKNNNGKIVIPEVIIMGESRSEQALIFENIEVTPHNLRNDVFKENVITAIDVILSLGDQEKITYELQWYDSIGTASIVRSYWVNAINEDVAYGRSGFVYEAGSLLYQFFSGNHIHLPSDVRILNSPEYVKYFWISI